MNSVERLIQELCPEGVEFKKLGEVFELRNGYTPSKSNSSFWEGGNIPWFRMEDIRENGRFLCDSIQHITPEAIKGKGLFEANTFILSTTATIGEHALLIVDSLANQQFTNLKIRKSFSDRIDVKYMFYYFFVIDEWCKQNVNASNFASVDMNKLRNLEIPLPPIEIQERIVEILDSFSTLTAELQAELGARKTQYEYYRDHLLSFDGHNNIHHGSSPNNLSTVADSCLSADRTDVKWVKLGEIAEIVRGNGLQKKDFTETGVGCIHYGQIYTKLGTFTHSTLTFVPESFATKLTKVNTNDIVMTTTSENVEDVCKAVAWLGTNQIVTGGHACVIKHKQNPKYLAYYFQTEHFFNQKRKAAHGVKVIDVKISDLEQMIIPLPTLSEQEGIVSILDRFEALTTDLQSGLPAEIEARQKQYEYYRNKLLTFKRRE